MASDYGDASMGRNLIIEVRRTDGLLLIGPPWLKGSEPFRVNEGRGRSLYTRDRFWLLRTIKADPSALQRLRAIWNQFDPMILVGRFSDYELADLVSDAIVSQKKVAALFLSSTPTAAFTAAQNQVQGIQHGASGSWDTRDFSETDTRPVSMWSSEQKIFYALSRASTSTRIIGDLKQVLLGFIFGPMAIRYIAAIAVWIALQIVPGVNITVDGVAMILAWSLAGYVGIKALVDFVKATIDAIQATSTRQLDAVADRYVDDLISLGALFLPKLVSKLNGGGGGNSTSDGSGSQGESENTFRPPQSENSSRPQKGLSETPESEAQNSLSSNARVSQTEESANKTGISDNIGKIDSSLVKNVSSIGANQANAPFLLKGFNAPYDVGNDVSTFTTTSEITLARVSTPDNPEGAFLAHPDDISGMNSEQIQQYLALPTAPTQISDVTIPSGTDMQFGYVAPQPTFAGAPGGAPQYQLMQQIPSSSFGTPRPLP